MADVKKVDKTAETGGVQNMSDAPAPADAPQKTFAQVRAEREASGESSNAVAATAYPESQPKEGEAKPSARSQKEMETGGKAVKAYK